MKIEKTIGPVLRWRNQRYRRKGTETLFTEEDVPAHLLAEKEIFMQLAAHPAPEIPEGLESRLSHKIDEWDTGERRTLK